MRYLYSFILVIASALSVVAQDVQGLDNETRGKYLAAIREAKHEFLARELQLTDDQKTAFFPIYDEMDDEIIRITSETRALENKVCDDADASETEIESAARTIFEQKSCEGQVELSYFEKFKSTLSPTQLLKLKNAERKFTQQLVRHHERQKNMAKNKP